MYKAIDKNKFVFEKRNLFLRKESCFALKEIVFKQKNFVLHFWATVVLYVIDWWLTFVRWNT